MGLAKALCLRPLAIVRRWLCWPTSCVTMTFAEINHPKDFCKDVSSLGRWGNGDVEVGLATLDELPYVMGLVRQSFERQMGNGEVA